MMSASIEISLKLFVCLSVCLIIISLSPLTVLNHEPLCQTMEKAPTEKLHPDTVRRIMANQSEILRELNQGHKQALKIKMPKRQRGQTI